MRAHAASERANARTHAHTSVHLYAHVRSLVRSHVHSSVHSFALRSSPRPLATRTPYVHRVSWSFKSIVYEALKKQTNNVQNRSNSARLPQCLNLTTSKTKQFCETSFKNGKLSAALGASCQCVLRFFHSTCVKYCACHEKLMPGHTKCCTCHAKSSQQT